MQSAAPLSFHGAARYLLYPACTIIRAKREFSFLLREMKFRLLQRSACTKYLDGLWAVHPRKNCAARLMFSAPERCSGAPCACLVYLYSSWRRTRCSYRSLADCPRERSVPRGPLFLSCSAELNSASAKVSPQAKLLSGVPPPALQRVPGVRPIERRPGAMLQGALCVSC